MAILLDNKPLNGFEDTKEVINILNCSGVEEIKKNLFLIKSNGTTFLKEKTNTWRNNPVFEFNVLVGNILHKNVKFVVSEESETMINHKQLGIRKKVELSKETEIIEESQKLLTTEPASLQPAINSQSITTEQIKGLIHETFTSLIKGEEYNPELQKFFDAYTDSFKQQFLLISEKISKREMYRAIEGGGGANAKQLAKGGTIEGNLIIEGDLTVTGNSYINIQPPDAVAKKYVTQVGDGLNDTFTITHNFNTQDILVTVIDNTTSKVVYPSIEYINGGNISVSFQNVPQNNAYKVIVIG
jgi:hypothetical protein